MSHLPQRIERNCLNCATTVVGRYCHNCGQENIEPKESMFHLVSHFFSDVTHFDGKFFTSLKDLVLKPGFLSREYVNGKRASYLNPIRMYLFISFIFFLVFFSMYKIDEDSSAYNMDGKNGASIDSAELKKDLSEINDGKTLIKKENKKQVNYQSFLITPRDYSSREEYDSLLKNGIKKHNWFERKLTYKQIEINEKYHSNRSKAVAVMLSKLQHSIPQMLFVLLPLFALFLKLLYIRHKKFYYTDHAIFTIHIYIFVFFSMLLILGFSKISALTGVDWLRYVNGLLVLSIFYYVYKAMRNFYNQDRLKTILKYFLLLFSFTFIGVFLFIVFLLISVFEI